MRATGGCLQGRTGEGEREREGGLGSCGRGSVPEHLQHEPVVIRSLQAWQAGDGAASESVPSQAGAMLDFCKEAGIADSA